MTEQLQVGSPASISHF